MSPGRYSSWCIETGVLSEGLNISRMLEIGREEHKPVPCRMVAKISSTVAVNFCDTLRMDERN